MGGARGAMSSISGGTGPQNVFSSGISFFQNSMPTYPMMSMGGARGAMSSISGGTGPEQVSRSGISFFQNSFNSNIFWKNEIEKFGKMSLEEQNQFMMMSGMMNPMMPMGGTMNPMRNFYSDNYHIVPSSTTITYEGILNAAYFKLNSKEEKKTINMEISLSSIKNPISNEKEVWLGTLFKSKYDGQKINKLIDLSIALDISGSMSGNKITMAKKALIQLIQKLNNDYIHF